MLRLGEEWSWARCMKYGWNKAKGMQAQQKEQKMKNLILAAMLVSTPVMAETSIETKADSPACKIADKKLAAAYVAKAPQKVQDRLENTYACACGVIYPSLGPAGVNCKK